ncbi:MAG: Unknown protein [uncultured Thiotrichaceae bacterium]|uniref:Uncharacterized protein n=1 Tax=uncultured Thiotrichaceae bacterium TaxID=298394 RepID=A0A6S6U3Z3_9GAMM|nr:MAG: Unknown protein [uncultured Thiotrichaceae bacterium]
MLIVSKPKPLFTLLLLVSMLFVQYGVSVHASEHMFHEHEEACEVYLNAERFADAHIPASVITLYSELGARFDDETLNHACECDKPLPQSRAPPAFLS